MLIARARFSHVCLHFLFDLLTLFFSLSLKVQAIVVKMPEKKEAVASSFAEAHIEEKESCHLTDRETAFLLEGKIHKMDVHISKFSRHPSTIGR